MSYNLKASFELAKQQMNQLKALAETDKEAKDLYEGYQNANVAVLGINLKEFIASKHNDILC